MHSSFATHLSVHLVHMANAMTRTVPKLRSEGSACGSRKRARSVSPRQIARVVYQYPQLVEGILIKRYKRFLADVRLVDVPADEGLNSPADRGDVITVVHCPNTGPMTGLLDRPLAPCWCSVSSSKGRKYPHTLEAIQPEEGKVTWVGIHSALANKIMYNILTEGLLSPQLGPLTSIRQEVALPGSKSRLDFLLTREGGLQLYVEVKSVTLAEKSEEGVKGLHGTIAKSTRGRRGQTVCPA